MILTDWWTYSGTELVSPGNVSKRLLTGRGSHDQRDLLHSTLSNRINQDDSSWEMTGGARPPSAHEPTAVMAAIQECIWTGPTPTATPTPNIRPEMSPVGSILTVMMTLSLLWNTFWRSNTDFYKKLVICTLHDWLQHLSNMLKMLKHRHKTFNKRISESKQQNNNRWCEI